MISFKEFIKQQLNEGKVDGLKDVSIIRHYTTGENLLGILDSGYIEARESPGDRDWENFDIGPKKVVSFHDARTDPEYGICLTFNDKNESIGWTHTLGTQKEKICACIEIDYDKLDKLIQDKAHLLNIYGQKVDEFVNFWNFIADNKENIIKMYKGLFDCIDYLLDGVINNKNSEEFKTLNNGFKEYYRLSKNNVLKQKIHEIFIKHLSDDWLDKLFVFDAHISREEFLLKTLINAIYDENGSIDKNKMISKKKTFKNSISFFERSNYKSFSDENIEELKNLVLDFNILGIIKLLRNHGWSKPFTDEIEFFNLKPTKIDGDYFDDEKTRTVNWEMFNWLNDIIKEKSRIINNANLEIRIASNINIDKNNCVIKIFDGLCNGSKQKKLTKLPKEYYEKYKIKHIKPGED